MENVRKYRDVKLATIEARNEKKQIVMEKIQTHK